MLRVPDRRNAKVIFKRIGGDVLHRAGRVGFAGLGLRERRRAGGMERDVAFDFLAGPGGCAR